MQRIRTGLLGLLGFENWNFYRVFGHMETGLRHNTDYRNRNYEIFLLIFSVKYYFGKAGIGFVFYVNNINQPE